MVCSLGTPKQDGPMSAERPKHVCCAHLSQYYSWSEDHQGSRPLHSILNVVMMLVSTAGMASWALALSVTH